MQSENLLESEIALADEPKARSRSARTKILIWIQAITFLAGLALLVYVIYRIGYAKVIESLTAVGFGFIFVIALNLARHLFRAASLYLSIEPEHRSTGYWSVVGARFGGEAVNFFSFAGPFLGDATKAILLKKDLSLTHSASAVIIDNILYYLSVIFMVLVGVAAMTVSIGTGDANVTQALTLIVVSCSVGFALLALALRHRITPISWLIKNLARKERAPGFLLKKQQGIHDVESNVFHFYHDRKADFFKVLSISLGVHVLSVAEVYLALRFLGQIVPVPTAFVTESLTKVINVAFSFIPGTIGVYEGGNGVILELLGYSATLGVTLALVRRGAILFSTTLGLIILVWRGAARGAKHLARSSD